MTRLSALAVIVTRGRTANTCVIASSISTAEVSIVSSPSNGSKPMRRTLIM